MDFVLDLSGFDDLDKELEIIANTTINKKGRSIRIRIETNNLRIQVLFFRR